MGHYKAVRLRIKELKQDNGKLRHCICLYHELSKRDDEEIMFWRGRARELENELQELQNKINNGLRVEVDFRGRDNLLPVVELADEDCTRFDEYGTYVGRVVLEE